MQWHGKIELFEIKSLLHISHGLPWDRTGFSRAQRLPTLSRARLLKAKVNVQGIYITHVYKNSVWSFKITLYAFIRNTSLCCVRNMHCLLWESCETRKYSVWGKFRVVLHPLVYIVTTRLWRYSRDVEGTVSLRFCRVKTCSLEISGSHDGYCLSLLDTHSSYSYFYIYFWIFILFLKTEGAGLYHIALRHTP
jgi:hypothetical protein